MTVTAKYILEDDHDNNYFALKPSLLKHQSFASVQSIELNSKGVGYITKKDKNKGLHIMFYNHIHGIIPLHECASLGKDWFTAYDVGDVVTVKVVRIDEFQRRRAFPFPAVALGIDIDACTAVE